MVPRKLYKRKKHRIMKKLLLLLLFALLVASCSTVKKTWVKENFAEKEALESLKKQNLILNK